MSNNPSIQQGQGNPNEEVRLLDNPNFRFVKDSLELLSELSSNLEQVMFLAEDKLKEQSITLRRMSMIKRSIAARMVMVKESKNPVSILITILQPHINFIRRYNTDLASLVSNYSAQGKGQDVKAVEEIRSLSVNTPNLLANLDLLLEKIESLEKSSLKEEVKKRVSLIKRVLGELKVLGIDLEDTSNWDRHFNDGVGFFAERVRIYFAGGASPDRMEFTALDNFKDEPLRDSVFNGEPIKELFRFERTVEAQVRFIKGAIAFLEKDLDPSGRQWIENKSTKVFFGNVEKYAKKFQDYFYNQEFAQKILTNKGRIGENPFAWRDMLKEELDRIKSNSPNGNTIIQNAKGYLSAVFKSRMDRLKKSIELIVASLNRSLLTSQDADLAKKIEKGIIKMEAIIKKEWKARLRQLKEAEEGLKDKVLGAYKEINQFINVVDMTDAVNGMVKAVRHLEAYSDTKRKIATRMNPSNPQHFSFLGSLAFVYARMGEAAEFAGSMIDEVREKDAASKSYKINELKIKVNSLLELYLKIIVILGYLGILMDRQRTEYYKTRIAKFRGDYYG